ncbi:hypothetical protein M9H77_04875 [Catharanthus roseus]|uniref:Uncharacterized protein n=1 Tax=Catharanthus roseus TaxID=4058 RepID=A0ACC0CFA2_CATRO|nr:hypothetical protein M9H77_04875 [Catharanthus roseus]
MDSEMRSLTDLLYQISISKVREIRHLAKRLLNPVLPEDPGVTLTSPPENVIGDGNCGYQVVADFVFGDKHQWPEVHRGMLYELEHSMNLYVNLVGSEERDNELVHRINWLVDRLAPYAHWFETSDSLYIVANAFNLRTTLYSVE